MTDTIPITTQQQTKGWNRYLPHCQQATGWDFKPHQDQKSTVPIAYCLLSPRLTEKSAKTEVTTVTPREAPETSENTGDLVG